MANTPSSYQRLSGVSARALSITPKARVLNTPLSSDDAIWKKLKEAGFDEDSIKRRDKAALISYITKLEAELFDYQHNMGLLILERKEIAAKYEEIKSSADAAEMMHKSNKAAHSSALAEARKREESLKKALGVEKECIASLEKALHEMRAESAETKVAAESKLAESSKMVEDAQKRLSKAEEKMHAAESMQAEATRYHRNAERKLQEVEAREDDLRRRIASFKSECDTREKEISINRQSLYQSQKVLQESQKELLDGQALLNRRENLISKRSKELDQHEKELESLKSNIEEERRALSEEKLNFDLSLASLSQREKVVSEREELVNKKEQKLHELQEKLASKESDEIKKAFANHESDLRKKKLEFEAELENKKKIAEDEIQTKRRAWELREVDLGQREELLLEREYDLEVRSRALEDEKKDLEEKSKVLEEREKTVTVTGKELELKKIHLDKEKSDIQQKKHDLEKSLNVLEDKKKEVDRASKKLEAMKSETHELSILEINLKEEIDAVRKHKMEVMAEADKLQVERAKFETEWDMIDEKREELRMEKERLAEERLAISKFIKNERESLEQEKAALREQFLRDSESLTSEREEFMNNMVRERTELFSKMQQERADLLLEIEMHKQELENCIEKRREELESSLRERENVFEQQKQDELQYISSLKESAKKELEDAASEMKRLDAERIEINLDRERREMEWAELNSCIEDLKLQMHKLKDQRESLHADRENILDQIERLRKLEDLQVASDNMALAAMQQSELQPRGQNKPGKRFMKHKTDKTNSDIHEKSDTDNSRHLESPAQKLSGGSPSSAGFSWIKRCAELIFKQSPERPCKLEGQSTVLNQENASFKVVEKENSLSRSEQLKINDNENPVESFSENLPVRRTGTERMIQSLPAVEDAQRPHAVDSKFQEDAFEKSEPLHSDEILQSGRKRRVEHSSPSEGVDAPEQSQEKKKRKQHEDSNSSEQATIKCVISREANLPEDHRESLSFEDSQNAEVSNLFTVNEVIKISEVTHEQTVVKYCYCEDKADCEQDPISEFDCDKLERKRRNGHVNSQDVENNLDCGPKPQGNIQVADSGKVADTSQLQEEGSQLDGEKIDDHSVAESDDHIKDRDEVGVCTRSRVKL